MGKRDGSDPTFLTKVYIDFMGVANQIFPVHRVNRTHLGYPYFKQPQPGWRLLAISILSLICGVMIFCICWMLDVEHATNILLVSMGIALVSGLTWNIYYRSRIRRMLKAQRNTAYNDLAHDNDEEKKQPKRRKDYH